MDLPTFDTMDRIHDELNLQCLEMVEWWKTVVAISK